jgi:hypothetical protein
MDKYQGSTNDKEIKMHTINLPIHILHQLQQEKGSSYRTAIKFREEDAPDFARYEYEIANLVGEEKLGRHCRAIEQELVITKMNKVYDILTVATISKPESKIQIYFDITLVFGK